MSRRIPRHVPSGYFLASDDEADARDYRREAHREYRAGQVSARRAEDYYAQAREQARWASWLTGRPHLAADLGMTPADFDASERTWTHIADMALADSFRATKRARWCAEMARRYEAMAAEKRGRYAAALERSETR